MYYDCCSLRVFSFLEQSACVWFVTIITSNSHCPCWTCIDEIKLDVLNCVGWQALANKILPFDRCTFVFTSRPVSTRNTIFMRHWGILWVHHASHSSFYAWKSLRQKKKMSNLLGAVLLTCSSWNSVIWDQLYDEHHLGWSPRVYHIGRLQSFALWCKLWTVYVIFSHFGVLVSPPSAVVPIRSTVGFMKRHE